MKFVIIGTGSIAGHFAKSIADLPNCQLVAVCSSTPERAVVAGERFSVPAYADYSKMYAEIDADIACICTQSGRHLEPTIAAAKAGLHVICEKPLEINTNRVDRMISACRAAEVKLACVFQNRYTKDYLLLKQAVVDGRLGRLISGQAYIKWYRSPEYYSQSPWKGTLEGDGGAALINQGIHTVDLLQDIMGDVSEVYAKIETSIHDIEGEDLAQGLLSFRNGAMGTIVASTALWPGYPERLEIYGESGSIFLEGGKISAWNIIDEEPPISVGVKEENPSGASDPMAIDYQLHKTQIAEIVEAIQHNREPAVNGEEGRKSIALIEAMYRSAREGRKVEL